MLKKHRLREAMRPRLVLEHFIDGFVVLLVLIVVEHQAVRDAKSFEQGNVTVKVVFPQDIDNGNSVTGQLMPVTRQQPLEQRFLSRSLDEQYAIGKEH